jgi:hypothetical protein
MDGVCGEPTVRKDRVVLARKEIDVRRNEDEAVDFSTRREEAVRWIIMRKIDGIGGQDHFVSESSFTEGYPAKRCRNPGCRVALQIQAVFAAQNKNLPDANGRKPQFVASVFQGFRHAAGKPLRLQEAPHPDVCV